MPLIVDDHGRLDRNSVASLSKDELRDWISDRLHGHDVVVPGDGRQGEYPHYLFASIYPEIDRDSRSYIRDIVQEFLRDMGRNEGSIWRAEAADALLLLAQKLREREFIWPVYEMAADGTFFVSSQQESSEDIHHRLLQTLVALDWKGSVEFWDEQFRRAPARYAGVVFAGLARIALQHAVDLLPHLQWHYENVQNQMRAALRGLLPIHDHSHIGKLLTAIMPQLSIPARRLILEYLPEVNRFIDQGSQWDITSAKATLQKFGHHDFRPRGASFAAR